MGKRKTVVKPERGWFAEYVPGFGFVQNMRFKQKPIPTVYGAIIVPIVISKDDHRANRISAAERRVVEAALATWPQPTKKNYLALGAALKRLVDLQRAKGGANG